MAENVECIGIGLVLGLVVIAVLTKFPGEPFDFTDDSIHLRSAHNSHAHEQQEETRKAESSAKAEIDRAAQEVKVEQLQRLLGLEKQKVNEMIEQAKAEAIKGTVYTPREPNGRLVWLDRSFLLLALGLLACVLWWDYSINLLSVFAYLFPREAETLGKVADVPFQVADNLQSMWKRYI